MRRGRALTAAFTILAVWAPPAPGADDEARRHGMFVDSVEVSLVDVEVLALHDGRAVDDLTAEDFEVFDDGRPVEITNFARREPAAAPASGTSREEPAGAAAAEPATVVVVIDQLFLAPTSRARVFAALTAELDTLVAGGARILVAAKSRDEVAIEQAFTADPAQVRAALDRLARGAPPGYSTEIRTTAELWEMTPQAAESRQVGPDQPEPALQTTELDARSAFEDARGLSQRIHSDVLGSLAALHRFLDSLAGLPGRKALVYVADQLPVRPAEPLWRLWWDRYGLEHGSRLGATPTGPVEFDASGPLESLISDANSSRVAFYPIGGGAGPGLAGAEGRGAVALGGSLARAAAAGGGDGLRWLAERTGGRGAVGSASMEGFFGDLAADLGAHYSLGYPSPHRGDGEIHRLEVRVRRPGIVLRYPTQYRDKSPDQRMTDRTLSALTLGMESNELDVRVAVGAARRAQGGRWTVPLEIHVPLANLVLLPDTTAHRGKLSVQLVARDERGRFAEPVLVRLPLEVAHRDLSRALTQTVDYATELTLADGSHTLAIGVHDDYGFSYSTVGVAVTAGGRR